jgi:hypothetical protein
VTDALGPLASEWTKDTPGIGKTWLQRTDDGGTAVANSIIPYTHFGISLITLLRIGLSGNTKTKLYGQFLQIPVYEDMATWNIQWTKGKLAYVDVDTMQKHLEVRGLLLTTGVSLESRPKQGSLPHAYQMILALMNYERTVADFGRCEVSTSPLRHRVMAQALCLLRVLFAYSLVFLLWETVSNPSQRSAQMND